MLGLGSAATPAGIMAFQELEKLEEERREKEKKRKKICGKKQNGMIWEKVKWRKKN